MCQNAFYPSLQGIRTRRSEREEQKTDVCPAKKKIKQAEKKFTVLFIAKQNCILKINCCNSQLIEKHTNNKLEMFIKMFIQAFKKKF